MLDTRQPAEEWVSLKLCQEGLIAIGNSNINVIETIGLLGGERRREAVLAARKGSHALWGLEAEVSEIGSPRIAGQVHVDRSHVGGRDVKER